jgi:hypothetical protein
MCGGEGGEEGRHRSCILEQGVGVQHQLPNYDLPSLKSCSVAVGAKWQLSEYPATVPTTMQCWLLTTAVDGSVYFVCGAHHSVFARALRHSGASGTPTLSSSNSPCSLQVGVGHDGHPLLYGAPLVDLEDCFPLQQPLLQELAPQSINMWMGCAPEGENQCDESIIDWKLTNTWRPAESCISAATNAASASAALLQASHVCCGG